MKKAFIIICIATAAAYSSSPSRSGHGQWLPSKMIDVSKNKWRAHMLVLEGSQLTSDIGVFVINVYTIFRGGDPKISGGNYYVIDKEQ